MIGFRSRRVVPWVAAAAWLHPALLLLSIAARQRYPLKVAPYLGYRDSADVTADGLKELSVKMNEYIDEADPRVSPEAPVVRC